MDTIIVKGGNNYIESTKKQAEDFLDKMKPQLKTEIDFTIVIALHASRESFNMKLGRQTADWEVGNTNNNKNEIDILDPDAFEKQSSHPRDDFFPILEHEIVHIFTAMISDGKAVPFWLNEGLSMYFAQQKKQYFAKGLYIEDHYVSKLATRHGWNTYSNGDAYRFSCLFVNYLIKKYSLEKVLILLRTLDKAYYQENFEVKFKNIFGISLLEVEKDFVGYINQSS